MRYQLYIDSFLFLNLMLNYFVLILMEQLVDSRLKVRWRLAGAALGTVAAFVFLLLPGVFGAIKAVAGQLILGVILTQTVRMKADRHRAGEVGNGTKKQQTFVQVYLYFWLSTILMGGILIAFRNLSMLFTGKNLNIFTEVLAGALTVRALSGGIRRYRMGRRQSIFQVELWQEGHQVTLKGLLDSGNSLTEPLSGMPVCLIGEKAFVQFLPQSYQDEHSERFRVIPFHSVGKEHGLLNGFLVEKVVVHRQGEDICRENVVLAQMPESASVGERYQVILNRCFAQ